jgi:hypothetical protein
MTLFLAILLAAIPSSHATDAGAAAGLLVHFKQFVPVAQDRLHHEIGASLAYRSERQRIDVVHLPGPARDTDERELKKACASYLADSSVDACELSRPLKAHQLRIPCPSPPGSPADAPAIHVIAAGAGCDPFLTEPASARRAPLSPDGYGKLTPNWAQEEVGSDLATELLDSYERRHPAQPTQAVPIGIIDVGMYPSAMPPGKFISTAAACASAPASCRPPLGGADHGTSAANLVVSDPPIGTGTRARISRASSIGGTADLVAAVDSMSTGDQPPKLVNMSMGCVDTNCSQLAPASLATLAQRSILVQAAGNDYPKPLDVMTANVPGIKVGSVTPNGLVSAFSQDGDALTISAPSDEAIQTIVPGSGKPPSGKVGTFSGTSGSAPVVTGALSNVLSLLPDLTLEEAGALLRKTAIRTSGFKPDVASSGAGSLNAYQLAAVAERLKEGGWPANRARILSDASLYSFSQEANAAAKESVAALDGNVVSCEQRKHAIAAARKAYFLDPTNKTAVSVLSQLYRASGYESQAQFIEARPASEAIAGVASRDRKIMVAIRNHLWSPSLQKAVLGISDPDVRTEAIGKSIATFGSRVEPLVSSALASGDRDTRFAVLAALKYLKRPEDVRMVLDDVAGSSSSELRAKVIETVAGSLEGADAQSYFNRLRDDPSRDVRLLVANDFTLVFHGDACRAFGAALAASYSQPEKRAAERALAQCGN